MKSGTGPDVILNCASVSGFNSDKVLVDLNPYMDGANGIDRSKYFDNIFRAFETNGKLYQLPLVVLLCGLAGNPELLGKPESWTLPEMGEKLSALSSEVYPISMMQDKVCALTGMLIRDLPSYCAYSELCSHDPLLIGWPSATGSGFSAYAGVSAGISAFSKCPDEA
ncbi:MAG: hypothetical protein IKZ90_04355 [Clostridiales bacterium]|nr:hypothetical protein [Clostridiales bacterium]